MRRAWLGLLVIVIGVATIASAIAAHTRTSAPATRSSCPHEVVETNLPVADALRAAQRKLAGLTINTQGTVYHLTPQNTPINFIAQLYTTGTRVLDQRTPGLLTLHRAAASACGERTAQASWAIHFQVGPAITASNDIYTFLVDTRDGWRFWGDWCGVSESAQWRRANCHSGVRLQ